MCSKSRFNDDSMVGVLDSMAYLKGVTMKYKPVDYQSEGLDEKVIDEILSSFRLAQGHVLAIGNIRLNEYFEYDPMTRAEIEEFKKLTPPPKKGRAIGPYDSIIRHLTALINNENLCFKHRHKYALDRDYYKARQEEVRSPDKKRMFLKRIQRDQIHDLVHYINNNHNLKESFDLAAQIWNVKRNGSLTAAGAKYRYWNGYK